MKYVAIILLATLLFTTPLFARPKQITEYDPNDAINPFKITSLIIRPPIALIDIFIKGFYYVLDSDPIRRPFNIEFDSSINIDEDY
jgi:hypothetical protein